jgi:hypothetical protein
LRSAQFISKYEPEKEKNKQKGTRKKNLNAETDGKDGMSIVMLLYTSDEVVCVFILFSLSSEATSFRVGQKDVRDAITYTKPRRRRRSKKVRKC